MDMKIKKKLYLSIIPILLLFAVLLFVPAKASAAEDPPTSGVVGTVGWEFDEDTGVLYLWSEGGGVMPDFEHYKNAKWTDSDGVTHDTDVPWFSFRRKIRKVSADQFVKNIGVGAFYQLGYNTPATVVFYGGWGITVGKDAFAFAKIASINMECISRIGDWAFYGATLPDPLDIHASSIGEGGFACAEGYTKIRLADNCKTIGAKAFLSYKGPLNINLSSKIETIGDYAFGYERGFKDIDGRPLAGDRISWITIYTEEGSAADRYAKANDFSVVYGKKFYQNENDDRWTFEEATGTLEMNHYGDTIQSTPALTDEEWSLFLDEFRLDVKKLILYAWDNDQEPYVIADTFSPLYHLEEVEIYGGDLQGTVISDHAFEDLIYLSTLQMNGHILSIGEYAFASCNSLKNITLAGENNQLTIEKIGAYAFSGCKVLEDISFIGQINNQYVDGKKLEIGDYAFSRCNFKTLEFGAYDKQKLKELVLGKGIFKGNAFLKTVTLGNMITAVPEEMFASCGSLVSFKYSNALTSIGKRAFWDCDDFSNLVFSMNLTTIGAEAYAGTKVNDVFIPAWITEIGSKAFCFDVSNQSAEIKADAMIYVTPDSAGLAYAQDNSVPYEVNEGGTTGNVSWRYNLDTKVLTVAGSGEMEAYTEQNNAPWASYEDEIEKVVIGNGITSVARKGFFAQHGEYDKLEVVVLGSSVDTVGFQAFYNCPLKEVELSSSVTNIGKKAFGYREDAYGDEYISEDLIMYVDEGSEAENYAIANGITSKYFRCYGEVGTLRYVYDEDSQTMTISGKGFMPDFTTGKEQPWHDFRQDISKVVIEEGVTSIGNRAFAGASSLSKIYLPKRLKTIGDYAFASDNAYKTYHIEMTIPDSVITIGQYAIGSRISDPDLTDITAGWSNSTVELYTMNDNSPAFSYADNWKNITAVKGKMGDVGQCRWTFSYDFGYLTVSGGGNGSMESEAYPWEEFKNHVRSIKLESIGMIPDHAFADMTKVETLDIYASEQIRSIGKGAFEGCTSLKTISGNFYGLHEIQEDTFKGCSSLTTIGYYSWMESIGKSAYEGCTSLTSVGFNEHMETIGESAFEGCTNLKRVTLGYSTKSVGERAFADCGVETLTIRNELTKIGDEAFLNTNLSSVDIPRSVAKVGKRAFGYKGTSDEPVKNESFTIITPENTPAHRYTTKNGFIWENPNAGDITEDVHWAYNDLNRTLTISGYGEIPDDMSPWDKFGENKIEKIIIGDGITRIGARTFDAMTYDHDANPTRLKISGSVESIGESAFEGTFLYAIDLPVGVISIDACAFKKTYVGYSYDFLDGSQMDEGEAGKCGTITIGDTVREIGPEAFLEGYGEYFVKSVTIPPRVKSIGEFAFGYWLEWTSDGYQNSRLEDFAITGVAGSEAERYANANQIPFTAYTPEEISDAGWHALVYVPKKEPTASAVGYEAHYECEVCGEWFEDEDGEVLIEDHSILAIPKLVELNLTKKTLKAGKTVTLKVANGTAKTWKSSNAAVAKVTSKGVVTALKKGSATITVTLKDGKKLTCKITVSTSPTITVGGKKFKSSTTYSVKKGKTLTVKITGRASSVANVYATTKKTIAKVTTSSKKTSTVKIKGLKAGSATVTIKVNGVAFKIKVKVTK